MAKMGRPPKDKALLLSQSMRITLTAEQKQLIERAAKSAGVDMAAWARPILVQAAKAHLGDTIGHKKKQ
jgi:hypothetical protein